MTMQSHEFFVEWLSKRSKKQLKFAVASLTGTGFRLFRVTKKRLNTEKGLKYKYKAVKEQAVVYMSLDAANLHVKSEDGQSGKTRMKSIPLNSDHCTMMRKLQLSETKDVLVELLNNTSNLSNSFIVETDKELFIFEAESFAEASMWLRGLVRLWVQNTKYLGNLEKTGRIRRYQTRISDMLLAKFSHTVRNKIYFKLKDAEENPKSAKSEEYFSQSQPRKNYCDTISRLLYVLFC